MNELVTQALKDLRLAPEDINYKLAKLWLEKMYLHGTMDGIAKVQRTRKVEIQRIRKNEKLNK